MKTPEELAEEYAMFGKDDVPDSVFKSQKIAEQKFDFLAGYQAAIKEHREEVETASRTGYLAGYKAAQEHAHAALEEAETRIVELQEQLADADKVMNSPEKSDSCEHILDMEKMVDVSSSATLNNWISAKTKLPDQNTNVLAWIKCGTSEYAFIETASGDPRVCSGWKHYNKDQVTHWQPLPEPPKEEG